MSNCNITQFQSTMLTNKHDNTGHNQAANKIGSGDDNKIIIKKRQGTVRRNGNCWEKQSKCASKQHNKGIWKNGRNDPETPQHADDVINEAVKKLLHRITHRQPKMGSFFLVRLRRQSNRPNRYRQCYNSQRMQASSSLGELSHSWNTYKSLTESWSRNIMKCKSIHTHIYSL